MDASVIGCPTIHTMEHVRALLMTDVVDSTKLSEELGDRMMAEIWTAHDRVARDLLPKWRGREIDKTDGMLLLFDSAAAAVNYTIAYHRALAALSTPLKARAGLHVGPVILRENSAEDVARGAKPLEVDGLAKPTAARVMSIALGGQTLLSEDAWRALDALPGLVQSHGHWMLKGLAEPIELFEVGADAAAFAAPLDGDKGYRVARVGLQWLPVRQIPNNLPQQITSFVGRQRELGEAKKLLEQKRLLTLLGTGGLGKTRLSLQIAADSLAKFPEGVWFVDLAPIADQALVPKTVAQVLGIGEDPGIPLIETIGAYLRSRRVLLVLDNCEHLIGACATLADALLRTAQELRILASSRELLHISGEQTYSLPPLSLPDAKARVDEIARSDAVRLFVERARLHQPHFAMTARNCEAVRQICSRLDGIPLALELAVARVKVLPVERIAERLDDRFRLLVGGSRTALPRQRTLRAMIDWSYDLLGDAERCSSPGFRFSPAAGRSPQPRRLPLAKASSTTTFSIFSVESSTSPSLLPMTAASATGCSKPSANTRATACGRAGTGPPQASATATTTSRLPKKRNRNWKADRSSRNGWHGLTLSRTTCARRLPGVSRKPSVPKPICACAARFAVSGRIGVMPTKAQGGASRHLREAPAQAAQAPAQRPSSQRARWLGDLAT